MSVHVSCYTEAVCVQYRRYVCMKQTDSLKNSDNQIFAIV